MQLDPRENEIKARVLLRSALVSRIVERSGSDFFQSPWPWITAAIVVVVVAVLVLVAPYVRIGGADPRGVGGVAEIEEVASRSDVNVLFILIDTLRADRMSAYGYERETTPNIDLLASRGVRFSRNLAQSSWTKASMASLWTGLYPQRAGVTRFEDGVPEEAVMPAEVLKEAGFRTAGIWLNGWVDPSFGFSQGFDVYTRPSAGPVPATVRVENPTIATRGNDADAVHAAQEFLRIHGHERWFLYLHLMDIHEYTYDEGSALFGTSYSDVYDNSIRRVDDLVGQLLYSLAESGDLEQTIVVITSDHGEAFRERGFEGHARQVFPESTEVPLIMSLPFMLEPGVVVDSRSANVDIWPTVFDMLGLDFPAEVDGLSQLPAILSEVNNEDTGTDERFAFAHLDRRWGQPKDEEAEGIRDLVAVVEGPYRLVRTPTRSGTYRDRLFDSRLDDGSELRDVIEEQPEVAERLRDRAVQYLDGSESPWSEDNPEVEIDEMQLNLLRALGYQLP